MRKPRAIIYDDDEIILDLLTHFLLKRGYQVYAYKEPKVCPIYENKFENCSHLSPCADLMISDYQMPKMTGIELYQRQAMRGCSVDIKMKAVLSGSTDPSLVEQCTRLGCSFFKKPFRLPELVEWLSACEKHFDLSRPLNNRRENRRYCYKKDIEYFVNLTLQETYNGTTLDKSAAGLGLHIGNPLQTGDKIRILKGLEDAQLTGEVRWCRKHGENAYRVGLLLV